MGKEISLAREEEVRRTVLLDRAGDGVSSSESSCRDSRKEVSCATEGDQGSQTSDTTSPRKSNAKNKGRNRRAKSKRGCTDPLRGTVGAVETGNQSTGRSSKELGIVWIDDRCEKSPITHAHHLIGSTQIDYGTIYTCKFCGKVRWLPNQLDGCQKLGRLMQVYGQTLGYQIMLDEHPAARRIVCRIQDIPYLRKAVTPEQFPTALSAIMQSESYPFDVEPIEEEIL